MTINPMTGKAPTLHRTHGKIEFSVFGRKDLDILPAGDDEEHRRWIEKEFLADAHGIGTDQVIFLQQVHGKTAHYVEGPGSKGLWYGEGDALYTDQTDLLLVIRTADCVPYFFGCSSPERQLAGIVHAGWRGLDAGIIGVTLERAVKEGMDCMGFTGPAIGFDAYEVGPEVAHHFQKTKTGTGDRFFLDLIGEAKEQGKLAGLVFPEENPFDACTYYKNDLFYSHRRNDRERNLNTVLIRP